MIEEYVKHECDDFESSELNQFEIICTETRETFSRWSSSGGYIESEHDMAQIENEEYKKMMEEEFSYEFWEHWNRIPGI